MQNYKVVFPKGQKGLIRLVSLVTTIGVALTLVCGVVLSMTGSSPNWFGAGVVFASGACILLLTTGHRRVLRSEGRLLDLDDLQLKAVKRNLVLFPFLIGAHSLLADPTVDPRTLVPVSDDEGSSH